MVDADKIDSVAALAGRIALARAEIPRNRALLVGISGIDAGGKGFITRKLAKQMRKLGWNVAVISADDWLNLPNVCINRDNCAEHFYKHAVRFDEMFGQLVIPLKQNRGISLTADCADAKATAFRKACYDFRNIDVVLLEGIFLLKPAYRPHFDLTAWVDCSFTTALKRAIARCQEGLPPAETIQAYSTIYFAAQRIHFARDNPQGAADVIIRNDNASRIHAKG
jgi:uridine kinase